MQKATILLLFLLGIAPSFSDAEKTFSLTEWLLQVGKHLPLQLLLS